MSTHAASQLIWRPGALLERTCLARRLAGTGAECGLPAAQLLSAVPLVVTGRDQVGVFRSRQPPPARRTRRAQAPTRDPPPYPCTAQNLSIYLPYSPPH